MADVTVSGRVGHVHRRQYDAFPNETGGMVEGRNGSDVYVVGQVLNDTPTLVKVDTPADIELLESAGQFAHVSIVCTQKRGKFTAAPGLVKVLEGANSKG